VGHILGNIKMSEVEWTENKVQSYIDNELEESLTLDYKDSRSLGKSDRRKAEITKDVSAMANSAGGLLIYGISEYQDADRSHLPEKITPIDQKELSKEWLEQII
jgi:predicted HTH transcriptional regulator